ncbi:hypothetical protein [Streptomyces acidiscabies]|uniref:Integral membrane protein n=1 Tax=Streptomyces acidiscabies TaxID=42234 RepID=A0ABU4MAG2_9ACTN|nr:hypothetical protein [Streptomyces acidiscabies]MBP5938552.1 hypothetical protein [Streptomyces sp. LBUM 1476]MDX3024537.1 hypothetical protein [Streptomyces acidiscabies]
MSSRTRARTVKTAAGVHTVNIPRQHGRRGEQVVIVVPERPTLTRIVAGWAGRALWRSRRALAPTALAVLAMPLAGVLHLLAWWSSLLLTPLAVAPAVWLLVVQRRRPAKGSVVLWRAGLVALATVAAVWLCLAAGFGPLSGPLPLLWLLLLVAAQTVWFFVGSRPARSEESV